MNAPIAGALFAVALLKLNPLAAAPVNLTFYIRGEIESLEGASSDEWSQTMRAAPVTQLEGDAALSSGMGDGTLVRWAMQNGASAHFDRVAPIPSAGAGDDRIRDVGPCFPLLVWTSGLLFLLCAKSSHRRRRSARVF